MQVLDRNPNDYHEVAITYYGGNHNHEAPAQGNAGTEALDGTHGAWQGVGISVLREQWGVVLPCSKGANAVLCFIGLLMRKLAHLRVSALRLHWQLRHVHELGKAHHR
jgi:hypothetical protein